MNLTRMKALFKREIKDVLRDKKTLIMMVLVPVLLYPLMILAVLLIMNAIVNDQESTTYYVAFADEDTEAIFASMFTDYQEEIGYYLEAKSMTETTDSTSEDAYAAYLADGTIHLYVASAADTDITTELTVYYISTETASATALSAFETAYDLYKKKLQSQRLDDLGIYEDYVLSPVTLTATDLSSDEESIGSLLGTIIPFLIVTSILMGAMYPAIDVTAGEKERGTLETLLTLPVTNFEMIMSKFLAVSCIASASAILNILCMTAAVLCLFSSTMAASSMSLDINYGVFLPSIVFTMVVMVVYAFLITAVSMCTCVFAHSFKEANNYITPVMLLFLFGSYVTMLPNVELDLTTAAVPVINVSLMIKTIFSFQYDLMLYGIVLLSTIAYSILAILVLGRIYNSEEILFSEGFSSVKLFRRRSEMEEKQLPGIGDLLLVLMVVLLAMCYLGLYAQSRFGFAGVALQQGLILVLPLAYLWYIKADFSALLPCKKIKASQLIGSLLLMLGAYVLAIFVGNVLSYIWPESAASVATLETYFTETPFILLLLVVAILPAVGEELLFRGFVYGALRQKIGAGWTVAVTVLLFAAYHMSLIKLFTIALIGFAITFVRHETDNILLASLLHFCNNGISVIISKYPTQIEACFPWLYAEVSTGAMVGILVGALVCFAGGVYFLSCSK